jgi:acetyl esterase/lipase
MAVAGSPAAWTATTRSARRSLRAAALRAIAVDPRRFGVDIDRLGIAGDSAGANLAVVLARETPTPQR